MTEPIQKPNWKESSGVYSFEWDALNVYVNIDKISMKDKVLYGEVTIFRKVQQGNQIVDKTRIDLLSDRSRNSLAGNLKSRNSEIDWLSILKYVCIIAVDDYRKGQPVEYLGGKPESTKTEYHLEPILARNKPTTIFADGGTGKSYLADYFAVLVQYNYMGFYVPGFSLNALFPTFSCNSLILDWESDVNEHKKRVWAIKNGLDIDNEKDFIFYRQCSQPLVDDVNEIKKIIHDNQIGFIIIDSQVAASEGEQDKSDGAKRYYNALRFLGCTSLTLDHIPKGNGLTEAKKPFGSTFKWNLSRSQFELKKVQNPGENTMQLALYHRKNNDGLLLNPIGYQIDFEYNDEQELQKVLFTGIDVPNELSNGETQGVLSRMSKMLRTCVGGKMELKNIAIALKLDEKIVHNALLNNSQMFGQSNGYWYSKTDAYGE